MAVAYSVNDRSLIRAMVLRQLARPDVFWAPTYTPLAQLRNAARTALDHDEVALAGSLVGLLVMHERGCSDAMFSGVMLAVGSLAPDLEF